MTNIGLVLSLIFLVLKLTEITAVATWTWLQVGTPFLVGITLDLIIALLIATFATGKVRK